MVGSSGRVVKTARRGVGRWRKLQARAGPWTAVAGVVLWGLMTPGLVRSSGGRLSWRETGSAEKGGKLQDRDVGQWFSTKGPVSVLQGGVSSLSRVPGPLAQLDAIRVHTSPPLLLYC